MTKTGSKRLPILIIQGGNPCLSYYLWIFRATDKNRDICL